MMGRKGIVMKKILVLAAAALSMVLSGAAASAEVTYGDIECSLSDRGYLSAENYSGRSDAAYVAAYLNGCLVDVQMPQVLNDSFSAVIDDIDSVDTVKVFFWENSENMKPVSAYTFDLESPYYGVAGETDVYHDIVMVDDVRAARTVSGADAVISAKTAAGDIVEYRVSDYTTIWEPQSENVYDNRSYDAELVWSGAENDMAELTETISAGDILLMDGYGSRAVAVIKMGDMIELAETTRFSWKNDLMHSYSVPTRDGWIYGSIDSNYIDDETGATIVSIGDTVWSFNAEIPIYGYEITRHGGSVSAEPLAEPVKASELKAYTDGTHTYDVPVMYTLKNDLTAVFVYRFKGESDSEEPYEPVKHYGLNGDEKYGWVVSVTESDGDIAVKLYDADDGDFKEFAAAETLDLWMPGSDTNEKSGKSMLMDLLAKCVQESTINGSEEGVVTACKYETDADGKLSKLYMAQPSDAAVSASATGVPIVFEPYMEYNSICIGHILNLKYKLGPSTYDMHVPEDMSLPYAQDINAYATGYVDRDEYLGGNESFSAGIIDYDPETHSVGMCIRFVPDIYASDKSILDSDWTANNHEAMVISDVAVDADEDGNDIAVIKGYSGGSSVEYRTTPVSAAYEIGANVFLGRNYDVSLMWDPTEDINDTAQVLADEIAAGDILLVDADESGNIKVIVRMTHAEHLCAHDQLEWTQDTWHIISDAREGWIGGDVESVTVDHNNNALIKFNEYNTFAFDADEQIDVIEIGADSASLSEPITAEELITEEEGGDHADILVMKTYRADVTHAFVYRFAF